MNDIVPHETALLAEYQELATRAREFAAQARAENTRRSYASAWRGFEAWCNARGEAVLPAEPAIVALYLVYLVERKERKLKASSLGLVLAAIKKEHERAGHPSPTEHPTVSDVAAGVRREKRVAPVKKAAATVEVIRAMVATLSSDMAGKRDRALLLVGFAGAFRRSELVGLDVADIEFKPGGMVVTLRKSKTDQEGEGRRVGIPYGGSLETCPVRALQAWLKAAKVGEGPLFRQVDRWGNARAARLSDKAVALVVKRCAKAAGLNDAEYSGHSLRSGFATTAAEQELGIDDIMRQTGHKNERMAREYVQESDLLRKSPAGKVGL